MPSISADSASSLEPKSGAKPPSSPTAVPSPRSPSVFLSAWKTSAPVRSASEKVGAPAGHDHELLEVDLVVGVGAAVEHVHHRHRQHVRVGAAEVAPQRLAGVGGRRLGGRPATRPGWRWRPAGPCCRFRPGPASRGPRRPGRRRPGRDRLGDLAVHVGHRLRDALAVPGARRRRAAPRPRTRRWTRPRAPPARPLAPEASVTSASTVGLPRLSTIWRAVTFWIALMWPGVLPVRGSGRQPA